MPIFRLQDNVPDVYTKLSRDFQLLCNAYDCVNDGVKFDIDSIRDITDLTYCNDRLMDIMQTKLGFFTNVPMSVYEQRTILQGFPLMVRNKGSLIGIKQCVELFLKSQKVFGKVIVKKTNMDIIDEYSTNKSNMSFDDFAKYTIYIEMRVNKVRTDLLTALLEYVIPAGYRVAYKFRYSINIDSLYFYSKDTINIVFISNASNSKVHTDDANVMDRSEHSVVSRTRIVGKDDSIESTGASETHVIDNNQYIRPEDMIMGEYNKYINTSVEGEEIE